MITIGDKSLSTNKEATLYSFLNLPEKDEEIIEYAKALREVLKTKKIGGEGNYLIARFTDTYIREIDEAISLYEKTGDMHKFFSKFCFADLGIRKALLKELEHSGQRTNKEVNDKFREYQDAWTIISNPESRREYDRELLEMRRIQAVQNEKTRARLLRKKLVRDEIKENLPIHLFNRSHLRGDKISRYCVDGTPQYGWEVALYEDKVKIFDSYASYINHPELDEKVEVFAHGKFKWMTSYRRDRNGIESPSVTNELCEVISIVRTDENGDKTVSYGIAQTRDLGYEALLTDREILDLEARGINVYNLVTEEEDRKAQEEKARAERRRRMEERRKPEDPRARLNRYLNKIGLELPPEEQPKRIELPEQKLIDTRKLYDPNLRHRVLVLEPRRYEISEVDKSDFARILLSENMIELAYEANGSFVGSFDLAGKEDYYRRHDDTIKACQYATKNPGLLTSRFSGRRGFRFNNLYDVYEYIIEQENNKKTRKPATSVDIISEIEFFGE